MLHERLKKKAIRSHPVKKGAADGFAGDHPITNHESFSHSVLFAGAHKYRAATADLLHGRTHGDPTKKPHEHVNEHPAMHLERGAHLRRGSVDKNV